jgi:hypothetical protein
VLSGILLLLGTLLLALALRQFFTEDDPDAPPPKWLQRLESLRPAGALAFGAVIVSIGVKNWVFVLAAVKSVQDAQIDRAMVLVNYTVFLLISQCVVLGIVLLRLLLGSRAEAWIDRVGTWLTTNMRMVGVAVSLVFGFIFSVKGLQGIGVL